MTHAELTAAVRGSLLADEQREHRHDCYATRAPRPAGRPDPVALWRSSSRSRQERVADSSRGGREPAVESVVRHGAQPAEPQATTERAGRLTTSTGYQPAVCGCGCPSGDHHPIIGAGVFAQQHGRCIYCPDCTGFLEEPVPRFIPGTDRRRIA